MAILLHFNENKFETLTKKHWREKAYVTIQFYVLTLRHWNIKILSIILMPVANSHLHKK